MAAGVGARRRDRSGLFIVFLGHWRAGSSLIGAAITVGGLLRLLPQQRVGLLAVRNRAVDSILLLGVGHRRHDPGVVDSAPVSSGPRQHCSATQRHVR